MKKQLLEVTFPKGHILLRAEKVESSIYFIKKGIVRAYANQDGNEVTFWFGKEGQAVISMKSYVEGLPGYEDIELLEDCELTELEISDLKRLFETDIHIANWGRRFAEKELVNTEERLIFQAVQNGYRTIQRIIERQPGSVAACSAGTHRILFGYYASKPKPDPCRDQIKFPEFFIICKKDLPFSS